MADYYNYLMIVSGIKTQIDMSQNSSIFGSVKVGTSGANTELTKAILDNLITLQDGSDIGSGIHHHDGRYFTESEIGSSAASSGSDIIGDDDNYTNFTPSAATVKGALSGIDGALGSLAEFIDSSFRVKGSGDDTKEMAFEVDGITTGTTRTITMPDEDVDLGEVSVNSTHSAGDGSDHQDVIDLVSLSGVSANSSDLGSFSGSTIDDSQTVKQALQALETKAEANESLIENFEWQESAKDYVVDNTAVPATEVSGDRYVLSHDGGAPHANYDGASAGDIVEFDGSSWVALSPSVGMFVAADDESGVLYLWGGSSWSSKAFEATTASTGLTKVGYDVRIADASANNGISISSGAFSAEVDDSSIEISSNALQVKASGISNDMLAGSIADGKLAETYIKSSEVDGSSIEFAGSTLNVKASGITNDMLSGSIADGKLAADYIQTSEVDGSSIEFVGSSLNVKALGIATGMIAADAVDKDKIAADVAGVGLGQNVDGSLEVNVDDSSIEIDTDTLQVKALGISNAMLAGSIADGKLAADYIQTSEVDGSSIEFAGSSLNVKALGISNAMLAGSIETSKMSDSSELSEAVTFFGSTDLSASEAESLSDGSNADSLHEHAKVFVEFTNNTGGAFAAGDVVALSKSVAGEIIAADASAIGTCEEIAGVVAESIADAASGRVQISGEATVANGAVSFDLGKAVYVSETAKLGTKTAPTTSSAIVYKLGGASAINKVILRPSFEWQIG